MALFWGRYGVTFFGRNGGAFCGAVWSRFFGIVWSRRLGSFTGASLGCNGGASPVTFGGALRISLVALGVSVLSRFFVYKVFLTLILKDARPRHFPRSFLLFGECSTRPRLAALESASIRCKHLTGGAYAIPAP